MQGKDVGLLPSAHLSFQKDSTIMGFLKLTLQEFMQAADQIT